MAPSINNPGGVKNDPDEIRDGVVSDSTRFPGGFIDQQITEAGANVLIDGLFQVGNSSFTQSFDVSSQDGFPRGIVLKPDGSQLYVVGLNTKNILQYSLSTAFDVSTASFVRSFDVSPQDGTPGGAAFKPDGGQLYFAGSQNDNIYQYSLTADYDISTASFVRSFDVSTEDSNPQGLAFRPDGSQLYLLGRNSASVYEYSLSTAYDISTASFVQSLDVSPQDGTPRDVAIRPTGSQLYVIGSSNTNVYQYNLSTDFDISTASFDRAFDVSGQETAPQALTFGSDGSRLYITGNVTARVYQYAVGVVGAKLV